MKYDIHKIGAIVTIVGIVIGVTTGAFAAYYNILNTMSLNHAELVAYMRDSDEFKDTARQAAIDNKNDLNTIKRDITSINEFLRMPIRHADAN